MIPPATKVTASILLRGTACNQLLGKKTQKVMTNRWGIPEDVEKYVLKRDTCCVYCGVDFSIDDKSKRTKPTWEHIINDMRIATKDNIALCCTFCNVSKGAKLLREWLESPYCNVRSISSVTVAKKLFVIT